MDGIKDEFQSVRDPNLVVDGSEMILHCLFRNRQVARNVTVPKPLRQAADDCLFSGSKGIDGTCGVGVVHRTKLAVTFLMWRVNDFTV